MACHIKTQFVPEIFNHPTWEDKIEVRMYVSTRYGNSSVISFNQDVWDTIVATNPENLKPFKSFRRTDSGRIEFSSSQPRDHYLKVVKSIPRINSNAAINDKAMATIHGYRDVRSAQANDKDDQSTDGGY